MQGWTPFTRLLIVLLAVAGALSAPAAAAATAQDVARVYVGSGSIDFEPLIEHGRLVLTVSGPEGFSHRAVFAAGETLVFSIFDEAGGGLPDGSYTWELRAVPVDVQRRDTEAGGEMATKGGRRSRRLVQSGSFAILDGAVVAGGETEPAAAGPRNVLGAKDQVVPDDLIVTGNLCVGFDCVNGESFGFDTIRLKENNTRIQFNDTSVGTFPSNNWQIRANETQNGGASFLGIVDQGVTGTSESGILVFAVEAGATANALRVDSSGRVGFGTATPVLHLHAVNGNTPGLRLEQDGSSSFTPQTWDMAGNEVNFFIRDISHGFALPFRIRAGAPTNSLFIDASGNVGLGTSTPAARLDVIGDISVSGTVDGRDVSADGATLDAHVTDFDNPHQVTAEQLGIEEDQTKAGIVAGAAFAGNPATATVTFADPFPAGTSYALLLTGVTNDDKDTASPTVVAKSETGFTVTLGNGNTSHVMEVGWLARPVGE